MQDDTTTEFADNTGAPVSHLPGQQFGSIRLLRQIGKGGMGEVWLARHELLGRDVAIKLLLTVGIDQSDPAFKEFIQGAKVAASLGHPAINKVLHADVAERVPYLVMEYLDGPNLQELIAKRGPLDLTTARTVIETIAEAVADLHQNDLLHRDLKPSNVMLTSDGRIVITDFGLACVRPASTLRGSSESVAGTPAYMAPEVFDGAASARTDVYAIGMTAYHLLAGRPAFRGTFDELRSQHQSAPIDVEPLRAANVPDVVIEAITRAISKEILFRPKTARHLLEAFRTAFDAANIQAASRDSLARLLKDRSESSPTKFETPASGNMAQTLSNFAAKKRDSHDDAPRHKIETISPSNPAYVQRKRAERRRIRIAGWLAALAGWCALAAIAILFIQINPWWEHQIGDNSATRSIGAQIVLIVVPIACLTIVGVGISTFLYRLLRGRPLPFDTENTRCGWCQHELRGITTPLCSECGHNIGDIGPDKNGLLPQSRQGPRRLAIWSLLPLCFIITTLISRIPIEFLRSFIVRNPIGSIDPSHLLMLLATFPGLGMAIAFYEGFLQFDLIHSGRAWCRICKAELRDLTEPICPTCGSPI